MPLNFVFFRSKSCSVAQSYIKLMTFLDPKTFVESWRYANFLTDESAKFQSESQKIAAALDEINENTEHFFNKKDVVLQAKVQRMEDGLTNVCLQLDLLGEKYFLRIPGSGSEHHICRQHEVSNLKSATALGINIKIEYINTQSGLYLGEFLNDATFLTQSIVHKPQTLMDVARVLKILHSNETLFPNTKHIFTRLEELRIKIKALNHVLSQDENLLIQRIQDLALICSTDTSQLVPCHNDTDPSNFLYKGNDLYLLDYDYSANGNSMYDIANFAQRSSLTLEEEHFLLKVYYGYEPPKNMMECFQAYKQLTLIWYYLWAELQLANKSDNQSTKEFKEIADNNWDKAMNTNNTYSYC